MSKKEEQGLSNIIFSSLMDNDSDFIPIIADGDEEDLKAVELPDILPILPLRNTVLFPGVVLPISVGREKSLQLVREVYRGNRMLGTVAQLQGEVDEPLEKDLHRIGTAAQILKVLEMPDGTTSVIIQGKKRFEITEMQQEAPFFKATVKPLEDFTPLINEEFEAVIGSLKDLSLKIVKVSGNIPVEAGFAVKNIENTTFLINFICCNSDINVADKQKLLEIADLKERGVQAVSFLVKELQKLELKHDIQSKVKSDLDQQQREFLLQQQIKTIQDELGGSPIEQDIKELKDKAKEKKWSEEMGKHFDKEVHKLSRLNPAAGEYSVQYGYVQTLLELPWEEYTEDNFDMVHAEEVLNEDHYGLEKVKERILEYLAVLKLKNNMKSPILCLYGPPGVGKTSLGRSVARALGRNYIRMSLGGYTMRLKFADTGKHTLVPCRDGLSKT